MKGKKFIAILCSICLIVSLIPGTAFAYDYTDGDGSWKKAYEYVEPGDVVWAGNRIAKVSNADAITIVLQSIIYKDADHTELYEAYGDIEQSIISRVEDEGKELLSPTNVVIDDVMVEKTKEKVTISYICTEIAIGCNSSPAPMKGDTLATGKTVKLKADAALEVQVRYYEDKDHKVPFETNPSETISLQSGASGSFAVPVRMVLDKLKYKADANGPVLEYAFRVKRYEISINAEDVFCSFFKVNAAKVMDNDFVVGAKIYKDKAMTKLIDDDEDGFTTSFVVTSKASRTYTLIEPGEVYYRLADVQDLTHDKENPRLIYVFYEAFDELSDYRKEAYYDLQQMIEDKLKPFEGNEYIIQMAEPDDIGIDGWTKETALEFASSSRGVNYQLGLDEITAFNGEWISLERFYYADEAMTEPVDLETVSVEAGKSYYLCMRYHGYSDVEGIPVYYGYEMKKPCRISFAFVDVDDHQDEIQQIKANLTKTFSKNVVTFDDLAWVNTLVANGSRLIIPSVSRNAGSLIKEQCPDVYEQLVGDTRLDLVANFGFAGDAGRFNSSTRGEINFYVDDVIYYGKYRNCKIDVDMDSLLYVPEGTEDYAAHVEKRINAYLGSSGCTATVEQLGPEELTTMLGIDADMKVPAGTVATYMTKYGLAFYSHPEQTTNEYFLESKPLISKSYYEKRNMKKEGSLDYFESDNYMLAENETVEILPAYKLTIDDESRDKVKSYICFIGIGTEAQMKEPYAEWKDPETDIITQGMNGQIPLDAYTKIRVIKGGDEIRVIHNKVGDDKKVHAFDINAFTNFKGGKLEDLGGGRMKVMIPLGELNRDKVKVHYVDDEGNVQDLEFTIETYEGQEYVSFITNHFSVYALSGEAAAKPTPTPCTHNWTAATCTTAKTCTKCKTTEGTALGHDPGAAQVTVKATTTKNGKIETKCTRCSTVLETATIKKASKVKLSAESYAYNGKMKSPKIYAKDSAGKTISSKYYTVSKPSGRKAIGKYTYTVKFKGNYSGTKKLTLTIKPVKPTIQTPKAAKKAITVKWKKGSKSQVTGYEVMVATNNKFTKNKKTATVKGYSKTSYKMTKLKAKTKYYVKVRSYKKTKSGTIYSDWSKIKSIKTK